MKTILNYFCCLEKTIWILKCWIIWGKWILTSLVLPYWPLSHQNFWLRWGKSINWLKPSVTWTPVDCSSVWVPCVYLCQGLVKPLVLLVVHIPVHTLVVHILLSISLCTLLSAGQEAREGASLPSYLPDAWHRRSTQSVGADWAWFMGVCHGSCQHSFLCS